MEQNNCERKNANRRLSLDAYGCAFASYRSRASIGGLATFAQDRSDAVHEFVRKAVSAKDGRFHVHAAASRKGRRESHRRKRNDFAYTYGRGKNPRYRVSYD